MSTTTIAAPESRIDVRGEPTTVRRAGAGTPMLFLHGAFLPTAWTPLHDALAARSDLVAPLHPGYAEGHPPDWLRGFDDLVLHYRALLDHLDLDRVDLVGYDLGGWIAAQLAAFYPERFRTLTLVAPLGLRLPDAPPYEFLSSDPARTRERLFGGPPGVHEALFAPPGDIEAFTDEYGENGVTARLIWERHYDVGLERRAARIDLPAHVITPEEDRIVPVVHAERWAELLPQGRLTRIVGVGHALVLQAPDEVAATICDFVEEVRG